MEGGREGRKKRGERGGRGEGREGGGREGCSPEKRSKEGGRVDKRVGVLDGERDDGGRNEKGRKG